jgi:hypothetical protein
MKSKEIGGSGAVRKTLGRIRLPSEISIDEDVASMQVIIRISRGLQVIQSIENLTAVRGDFFL